MIFRNHFPVAILIYYRQLAKSRCYATIKQRCTHTQIFTQNEATNQNETKNDSHNPEVKYFMFKFGAALGFTTVLLDLYKNYFNDDKRTLFTSFFKFCKLEQKDLSNIRENASDNLLEPPERSDLRIISLDEVKQHGRDASRIWVIYKRGVYDITDFVVSHPGGDKILLAAGGSIEPFWTIYAQHKTNDVMEMLEEMRIGSLTENDICLLESKQNLRTIEAKDDPFHNDPLRHPALLINSQKPFNAETPPSLLVDSFITPNELFFVRNHMPVPELDENTHRIEVGGVGIKHELSLSVTDLKNNFEKVTIVSSLQCAGNRRKEMNIFKKVQGLMWTGTAISNAKWTGCRLRDVLISAGVKPEDKNIRHIQLEGADTDSNGGRYGASIPFEKAMSPEVIIAYEMNDKPIPKDHGYPLRLIVPGIVGARQVKWLSSIRTSTEESGSHWQRNDYKALPNSVETSDPSALNSTPSIQDCPVQSVICAPAPNIKISSDSEKISVNGYAWSGGGRGIIRVEVSCDGGETWKCAQLQQCPGQDLEHMWAWTLWNIDLEIPKHAKKSGILELVCKATDRAYNTQPETSNGIWNVRGLLYNARHRIQIKIE